VINYEALEHAVENCYVRFSASVADTSQDILATTAITDYAEYIDDALDSTVVVGFASNVVECFSPKGWITPYHAW
jgi:hypothetical protein